MLYQLYIWYPFSQKWLPSVKFPTDINLIHHEVENCKWCANHTFIAEVGIDPKTIPRPFSDYRQ